MKQKDLPIIIAIVVISALVSYFLSNKLIVNPTSEVYTIPTVGQLNSSFTPPSDKYFNGQSVDPTQLIHIGNNSNTTPFNGTN